MYPSSMSVIGIDCRFAALPVGIGRYTRELVAELIKRDDPWTYVLFVRSADEFWIPRHARVKVQVVSAKHYSIREQFDLPRAIRRSKIDLYFAPQFNVPIFCPVPFVTTIHDLILHRYPNQAPFLKRLAYRLLMWHAVRYSAAICTVSNATKQDLVEMYDTSIESKIHTAYPGIGAEFTPARESEKTLIESTYNLPKNYFLYVGSSKEHKNVQALIDGFDLLKDDSLLLVLVIFGDTSALRLTPRCAVLSDVPDAYLAALYSGAAGFASATLYEGFGLPFLEAMACHTPVLGSDIAVLREICGDTALLVPPTPEAFELGLRTLLEPDQHKIEQAATHAATFTWNKTATEVASVLSSALKY